MLELEKTFKQYDKYSKLSTSEGGFNKGWNSFQNAEGQYRERVDKTLPDDKIIITSSGLIKSTNNCGGFTPSPEQQNTTDVKTERIINKIRGYLGISGVILLQTNPDILKGIGAVMTGSAILYDAAEPIVVGVSKIIKKIKTRSSSQ